MSNTDNLRLLPTNISYTIPLQPVSLAGQSGGLFIYPDNVESLASFIDDSVTIEERAISFGQGEFGEILLEVPLGFIEPHATIRITVGLDDTRPSAPVEDYDLGVGISDGNNVNDFKVRDVNNYAVGRPPCDAVAATSQDGNLVDERTHAPAQAVMVFKPLRKYGACYLPLDGGYVNTATFNDQLDLGRSINLILRRDNPVEEYGIYYILVEIFQ